jgi:hypothetical protein
VISKNTGDMVQIRGAIMNKKKIQVRFKFVKIFLTGLSILLMPLFIYAGDFYQCHDRNGNESLMDFPIEGQDCKKIEGFEENTVEIKKNNVPVPGNNKITKVRVIDHQVLVPVTLVYDNREINVTLLMDTGASSTVIHTDVADQLYINIWKMKKVTGGVFGGGTVDVHVVTMDVMKIGPHEIYSKNIGIVNHEGYKVKFDGLLGMDILSNYSYRLDMGKQQIIWE